MTHVPSERSELVRKLARIDQVISARETWLAEHRTVSPGTELATESLLELRLSAERIVVLLRAPIVK